MTSPAHGRSLELYYINGRPDGMLTAEMFNWTGHVLLVPRTQLSQALARTEAGYAGIYLLLGEKEGEPLAYVGESEDIGSRIKSHDAAKDWWSIAVLVTTAGNKLNKAHVRYLEARLIEQAKSVGRTLLDNGTSPPRPTLSEADVSKMEAFLENIFIVLPAVRVDLFIQRTRPTPTVAPTAQAPSAEFILETKKHGVKARAVLVDGEFVVEAGSTARLAWEGVGSEMTSYGQLHQELRNEGVLQPQGTVCVFAKNYAFKSPSAAAAVVNGRPANGTVEWKTPGGQTYKEWEAQQLSAVPAS
ncbi:GIY-YIG nuclease family protein [Bradyrhizobium diazoefficiens]|nr:GIY-YIG nuclease family protein [Bradyrhizobium diazoefficiens]MBR0704553.1 GIY-YIG nuclease family protein [Bradyrhizobium diazoefficiens]MBR0773121.1 GIY-YIG nuclease family protein [Bradyrhizobium diazoefficiens]